MQHDAAGSAPQASGRSKVLLLGSADLDWHLVVALQRLGAEVIAVDRRGGARLHRIADQVVVADPADADEIAAIINRLQPGLVVTGAESVATGVLIAAAEAGAIEAIPSIRAARLTASREVLRRLAADDLGLPTVPFWFAGSIAELRSVAEHAGFPLMVRPVTALAHDGQSLMVRADDVEPAWQLAISAADPAAPKRVLAETVVDIDYQVSLLAVRSTGPAGPVLEFCAPIGHRHIEGQNGQLILETWQPQAMGVAVLDAAKSIAARVVRALGGRGVFGIELLICADEVYFAGVKARLDDIAWLTARTQRLSGFELQARAILGLPVDTIMISPGAARLTYAAPAGAAPPARPDALAVPPEVLAVAESDVVVFAADDADGLPARPRPRLALAVATAAEVTMARDRAGQVAAALGKLWL